MVSATVSPRSRACCGDRVPTVEGSPGGGDTAAAMGILSSGFRAKLFLSLWWSLRSWLLSFPPNASRGERCGVWGRLAPSDWVLLVSCGAFPLRLPEELFSPRAICYPQAHPQGIGACIMTYSGREEERAPSIYRSSSLIALSGGVEGAPFQRVFLPGRESFSLGKVPPSMSVSVEPDF